MYPGICLLPYSPLAHYGLHATLDKCLRLLCGRTPRTERWCKAMHAGLNSWLGIIFWWACMQEGSQVFKREAMFVLQVYGLNVGDGEVRLSWDDHWLVVLSILRVHSHSSGRQICLPRREQLPAEVGLTAVRSAMQFWHRNRLWRAVFKPFKNPVQLVDPDITRNHPNRCLIYSFPPVSLSL